VGNTPGLYLKIFVCPNDTNKLNRGGGNSYAANAGYASQEIWGVSSQAEMRDAVPANKPFPGAVPSGSVDWWDSGDSFNDPNNRDQGRASGAFVHHLDTPNSLDGISSADGLTNTVFFAENLNSDNWASPNIAFNAIIAPVANTSFDFTTNQGDAPATGLYLPRSTTGWYLQFINGAWSLAPSAMKNARINQLDDAGVGQAPRPSSNHTGGLVIVGFGDGSSKPISDNIDERVWGRMLTSRGTSDYEQLLEGSN
jgi:hypothetical protein